MSTQSSIAAYMLTCSERSLLFEQTLRHLGTTDWPELPRVVIDEALGRPPRERVESAFLKVLEQALGGAGDMFLLLEDDLEFNRYLSHNLWRWLPLARTTPSEHFFASLYNPGVRELECHLEDGYVVADPESVYGSQAMLMSRATAEFVARNWWDIGQYQDIKLTRLASRVAPLLYHVPSLVQHVGYESVWGGGFHQAADYQPEWQAGMPVVRGVRSRANLLHGPVAPRGASTKEGLASGGAMLTTRTARKALDEKLEALDEAGADCSGSGIVIPGGGPRYLPGAWVLVRMLRHLQCQLPIQLWHLGPDELPESYAKAFSYWNVARVDAHGLLSSHPARRLGGWELKAYAIAHCPFRHVILLDADNLPLVDPASMFDWPQYLEAGAIFWPDIPPRPGMIPGPRWPPDHPIWELVGLAHSALPEFESGQICVDKRRHVRALGLAMWMNEHSDFWYRFLLGDKDTFRLAWHKTRSPYRMTGYEPSNLQNLALAQHDFSGNVVFQHRCLDKWRLQGDNRSIPGYLEEERCRGYLAELRAFLLAGGPGVPRPAPRLTDQRWLLRVSGREARLIRFREDGSIEGGGPDGTLYWRAVDDERLDLLNDRFVPHVRFRLSVDGASWIGVERSGTSLLAIDRR